MGKPYALFTLGRPVTSALIAFAIFAASLVGSGPLIVHYRLQVLLGAILGLCFGVAGCAMNDYFDRNIDQVNHPERPIPSGEIGPRSALNFSLVMFALSIGIGIVLSTSVGYDALLMVLLAFALQIGYELSVKKMKWLGNILMGVQTVLAFTFGGVIVGNPAPTMILAVTAFLSIVGREIVKDVEDIRGDVDKVTLPKIIGMRNASIVASVLIVSAVIVSIAGYYPFSIFGITYLILILGVDVLFLSSIPIIFRNPRMARRVLKYAMLIAIVVFVLGRLTNGVGQ